MAANTPPGPHPDRDPAPADKTIPPADAGLGPVEPLDVADEGLVLTGEGVSAPPGVAPPAGTPAPLERTAFDLGLPAGTGEETEAAIGGTPTPTAPAEGWYESSTRLPRSVAPPAHPPSQSSVDIDIDLDLPRPAPKTPPPQTFTPADVPGADQPASDSSIEIELPSGLSASGPQSGPGPTPSAADIDLPPARRPGEEPSDIFSNTRPASGSDALGTGGSDVLADAPDNPSGSDLFAARPPGPAGVSGLGSSVFDQKGFDPPGAGAPGSADFSSAPPPAAGGDSGSSLFDALTEDAGRVDFGAARTAGTRPRPTDRPPGDDAVDEEFAETEHSLSLAGGGGSGDISGFDKVDKGGSGSDLFGDATVVDMNLLSDPGTSGLNLHDPDAPAGDDAAGLSSIFSHPDKPADGGRVDLGEIPLLGEAGERTDQMLGPDQPPAARTGRGGTPELGGGEAGRSAVSFDLAGRPGPPDALDDFQDSGSINWSGHDEGQAADDLIDTAMAVRPDDPGLTENLADDEDALVEASGRKSKPPADEESVFAMPAVVAEGGSELSDKLAEAAMIGAPVGGAGGAKPARAAGVSLATKRPPAPPPPPTGRPAGRQGGGLLVGALGLLVGAGAGAAGMYFAGGGNSPAAPGGVASGGVASRGADPGSVQPAARPDAGLIGTDPAAALRAFEQAGNGPEARSGRGQARWLARVRAAAAENQPLAADDAELVKARAELLSAFDTPSELTTPAEQMAGMRAALHLGLIQEMLGDPDGAEKVYRSAQAKLPFAKVFESALQRVKLMRKDAAGGVRKQYTALPPADAADLAGAVAVLDFPPVQEELDIEAEPAYHFWRAINYSVDWQAAGAFANAIKAIDEAKAKHEARRKKVLGMGLNPLSDPTEQAFTRACEELHYYWAFKQQLYSEPVVMAMARNERKGTGAILADLMAAKKQAGTGGASAAELASAKQQVTKLTTDLTAARTAAAKADGEKKAAEDAARKVAADFEAAKKDLGEKAREAAAAREELAAADRKLKAAEKAVGPVVEKLKDVNLIDKKLDPEAALAALPEAVRKAVIVTGKDSQATELAAALDAARKAREEAEAKAKQAEAALADAKADATKKAEALESAKKAADDRVAAEVRKATDAAAAEVAKLTADRRDEAKRYEEKLSAQAEQFRAQLVAVRSGAAVPLTDVERAGVERARRAYGSGLEAYRVRQYGNAEGWFAEAVKDDPADARYWYYLGLSKWAQGKAAEAREDFKKGADWEARNRPGRRVVGEALVWVQGPARTELDNYRP